MIVTRQMMLEAIDTAYRKCDTSVCYHEAAISLARDRIYPWLSKIIADILMDDLKSKEKTTIEALSVANVCQNERALICTIFDTGLHVGYRLRQLEEEVEQLENITKSTI